MKGNNFQHSLIKQIEPLKKKLHFKAQFSTDIVHKKILSVLPVAMCLLQQLMTIKKTIYCAALILMPCMII